MQPQNEVSLQWNAQGVKGDKGQDKGDKGDKGDTGAAGPAGTAKVIYREGGSATLLLVPPPRSQASPYPRVTGCFTAVVPLDNLDFMKGDCVLNGADTSFSIANDSGFNYASPLSWCRLWLLRRLLHSTLPAERATMATSSSTIHRLRRIQVAAWINYTQP